MLRHRGWIGALIALAGGSASGQSEPSYFACFTSFGGFYVPLALEAAGWRGQTVFRIVGNEVRLWDPESRSFVPACARSFAVRRTPTLSAGRPIAAEAGPCAVRGDRIEMTWRLTTEGDWGWGRMQQFVDDRAIIDRVTGTMTYEFRVEWGNGRQSEPRVEIGECNPVRDPSIRPRQF